MGQVSIGSYEHISGMVMAGHKGNGVISAFILKVLMPLVFIRTFPSSSFRGCKEEQDIITQNKHCLERKADEERVLNIALVSLAFSTIWMGSHSY